MVLKLEVGKTYEEIGTGKLVKIDMRVAEYFNFPFICNSNRSNYEVDGRRYNQNGPDLKEVSTSTKGSPIDHPSHYTTHPSGIECITVTEHMGFNLGNAVKYLWRCDLKKDAIEDLKKAAWYIQREITKREEANK